MAEILVGKNCSFDLCKQLDFLPFTCDGCGKIFCLDHRNKDTHQCEKGLLDLTLPEYDGPKSYVCSFPVCKGRELMEVLCPHCHNNYCLSHRHQTEHNCKNLVRPVTPTKTADHVKQILERQAQEGKPKKVRGGKSAKTAAKVALMKLKMKSSGDKGLPETQKVYLNVKLPLTSHLKEKPMFFSKTWSVGRIIDNVAESCNLKNNNNVANEQKLRLFSLDTGSLLPASDSLTSFLDKEELFSGSTVILEYVSEETDVLDSLDRYIT